MSCSWCLPKGLFKSLCPSPMLTIIDSPAKVRRFLVYDLEWIPGTMQVRLVGCYDGVRYRAYSSVKAFLENEMTSKNRAAWFYAHAGGLADIEFVLKEIIDSGSGDYDVSYRAKASFSGSSAIICHVSRGKNSWHFVDSYWTLRAPLAEIAEWVGMKKGGAIGFDEWSEAQKIDFYAHAPLKELREYNEIDCKILWHALDMFETALIDLGGQMQMTLASSAMQLFRRGFLKADIGTAEEINCKSRESYIASRVEDIGERCGEANYYDINSSFPYAMTKPCPGEYLGSTSKLPDSGLFLARCKVKAPNVHLPPLPYKAGGRVFFPTGEWEGWFSNVDLELLQREGGKISFVSEVLKFAPFDDLAEYATNLYDRRRKATGVFEKQTYKLLLNSLYGKFGEGSEKQSIHVMPTREKLTALNELAERVPGSVEEYFPGVWAQTVSVPVPHMHVPIAAHITALARMRLYDCLIACDEVFYCDTDSIVTTDTLPTGEELGELKLEYRLKQGRFYAPKLYDLDTGKGRVLRAKGFSIGKKNKDGSATAESLQRFEKLAGGDVIEVRRMGRVKEMMRRGITQPYEGLVKKRLKTDGIKKRFHYPDGYTRPWSVGELRRMFNE